MRTEGLSVANVIEGVTITTSYRDTSIDIYRARNTGYIEYTGTFESEDGAIFESE